MFRMDACGVLVFVGACLWVVVVVVVVSTTSGGVHNWYHDYWHCHCQCGVIGCSMCFSADVDGVSCVVGTGDLSPSRFIF